MKYQKKLRAFLILNWDDIIAITAILFLTYYFAQKYFIIAILIAIMWTIFGIGLKSYILLPSLIKEKPSGYVGKIATVTKALNPSGYIKISGEIWKAETLSDPIEEGSKVKVCRMDEKRLILHVEKI
ncbi:MAG: NfeD family protein [Candidatus Hodarchaeota archaeon]